MDKKASVQNLAHDSELEVKVKKSKYLLSFIQIFKIIYILRNHSTIILIQIL